MKYATTIPVICALLLGVAACSKTDNAAGDNAATKKNTAAAPAPAESSAKKDAPAAKSVAAKAPSVEAKVGAPAPTFELTDLDGKTHKLADYSGKTVVLEWFNPGCPFVVHAHEEGPLKTMAGELGDEVVWLAINSGAPGKQGHALEANKKAAQSWSMKHPVLRDESGEVGKRYGAIKTPQVYLIDGSGVLRYAGAIDNAPVGKVDGEDAYTNYLTGAMGQLSAGKDIDPSEMPAYGCSVKYAS